MCAQEAFHSISLRRCLLAVLLCLLQVLVSSGIRQVEYFGKDRHRYQIEVPAPYFEKAEKEYTLKSQKKGCKRFWTKATAEFSDNMRKLEQKELAALGAVARRVYEKFSHW